MKRKVQLLLLFICLCLTGCAGESKTSSSQDFYICKIEYENSSRSRTLEVNDGINTTMTEVYNTTFNTNEEADAYNEEIEKELEKIESEYSSNGYDFEYIIDRDYRKFKITSIYEVEDKSFELAKDTDPNIWVQKQEDEYYMCTKS